MSEQQNQKVNRFFSIAFLTAAALIMVAGLVKTVFFPKDINYYENRPAVKLSGISAERFLSSELQDNAEDALADQVPAAQSAKKLYNSVNSAILMDVIEAESAKYPEEYYKYNGVFVHDGYLLWVPFDFDECRDEFDATIESFNLAAASNPDTEFFLYYIENDSVIDFRTGERTPAYEYVCAGLSPEFGKTAKFSVTDFDEFKTLFYRTDHHWNHRGSYKGYQEIMSLLGCEEALNVPLREVELPYLMVGSKSRDSGLTEMKEYPSVYEFSYPELGAPYGSEAAILNGEIQDFSYEMFYGVNLGEYMFDTGRDNRENILIIGDSFDNAVLKLIAEHYHKTYSIDMRNLDPAGSFNITDYIRDHDIDRVLIVASQVIFSSGEYILES